MVFLRSDTIELNIGLATTPLAPMCCNFAYMYSTTKDVDEHLDAEY